MRAKFLVRELLQLSHGFFVRFGLGALLVFLFWFWRFRSTWSEDDEDEAET
jgi:hypothetical protein